MSIPRSIKQYLFHHSASYSRKTQAAEVESIPEEFVRTAVLQADGRLILVALPGDHAISLEVLKQRAGWERLLLVSDQEFAGTFPSCQSGAIPPFGKLFGVPLYCDTALAKKAEIEFNAGTHADIVRMKFATFAKLENPIMLRFSEKRAEQVTLCPVMQGGNHHAISTT